MQSKEKLREFGLTMAMVLTAVGVLLLWKGRPAALWWVSAALLLQFAGVFCPRWLAPLERGWMWFGEKMGLAVTTVLLAVAFFLVMLPMGLLVRALGKDLLGLKFDRAARSYWVPIEPDGPHTRPHEPY